MCGADGKVESRPVRPRSLLFRPHRPGCCEAPRACSHVGSEPSERHGNTEAGGEAPGRHSWWSRTQPGEAEGQGTQEQARRPEVNIGAGKVRDLRRTPASAHTLCSPASASHQPYFRRLPCAWYPALKRHTSKSENAKGEQ